MKLRSFRATIKSRLRIQNLLLREFLAEFFGTFTLIAFGCAANAQSVLSGRAASDSLSVAFGWAWAVAMAIWISGGVTGGHLNPAITVAMAVLGRRNLPQMFVYWIAQYCGAFVGSACVFWIYRDALNIFDSGHRSVIGETATAGIWATYPQPFLSLSAGICDQIFGTFMLTVGAMALSDKCNMSPGNGMFPVGIAGLITVINLTYTFNCGGAINPARDFSPRLFTAIAGWGMEVFTAYNYWFWVPLVIPHFGAICGAMMYQLFVGIHTESAVEIKQQSIGEEKNLIDSEKSPMVDVEPQSDPPKSSDVCLTIEEELLWQPVTK